MSGWVDTLARLCADGDAAVLVSVVATRGSAPRESGTRMIVTSAAVDGTIGGGHLELQAIGIARDLIAGATGGAARLRRFPLGASLGQCCGGVVNLLFEPIVGDASWLAQLESLQKRRTPCVLVSPAEGAAHAERLIVTADSIVGTLGANDPAACAIAREMLLQDGGARLVRCGNGTDAALLFFDPLRGAEFNIVLFGAGHVGRALVRVLAGIECNVTWVDARDDEFPREVPANVTVVCTDIPEAEVDAAAPDSYFLVMTHSHPLDLQLAEAILARGDFAYFGLIGSLSKRRQFERRLVHRGMPPARIEAMTCPIGVAGITGKEPATIAIAVAAELLQVRARSIAAAAAPAVSRTQSA